MRYQSKSAISYIFRNFWHIAPISLGVAVLLGFCMNDNAILLFAHRYADGLVAPDNILSQMLSAITVLRFGKFWWLVIISLLLFVFVESMLLVKVSHHMRTGAMLHFPIKRTFSVFPTVLLFLLGVLAFEECLRLCVVGVAYLLRSTGLIAVTVVSAVLLFAVEVFAVFCVGALVFAFPIMFVENYSFNSALSYSVRLMSEKRRKLLLFSFAYPLVRIALTAICGLIGINIVTVVLYSVFYLFCIIYVPALSFRMYYSSVGGERRDISRVIFD